MPIHANIIIVGAGLVGSALACALAQQDKKLSILVLEASSNIQCFDKDAFDPRVVALSGCSTEFLESLGVWQTIVQQRVSAYQGMSVWDGEGNGSIAFHSNDIHADSLGHIVENSIVLTALRNKMEQDENIQFLAPAEVVSMSLMDDGPSTMRLSSHQEVSGDFIVGADGARSILRSLADISTKEWDYGHSAIVTTVRTEASHQNTAWQRFSQQGPLAFLPLKGGVGADGHYCSIVWSLQQESSDTMMALGDKAFCERLSKTFEYKLGAVEWADKRFCIPLRQRYARNYGRPGFALVGDAAHTIHPLAGQGVNLGLADAKTLGEEILRARERSVTLRHPSIVKRYQRSRKPHNLVTMAAMEGFKRLFGEPSLGALSFRNRGMDWVDGKVWLKRLLIQGATS